MNIISIRSIQQVIIVTDDLLNCIYGNYIEKRVIKMGLQGFTRVYKGLQGLNG